MQASHLHRARLVASSPPSAQDPVHLRLFDTPFGVGALVGWLVMLCDPANVSPSPGPPSALVRARGSEATVKCLRRAKLGDRWAGICMKRRGTSRGRLIGETWPS